MKAFELPVFKRDLYKRRNQLRYRELLSTVVQTQLEKSIAFILVRFLSSSFEKKKKNCKAKSKRRKVQQRITCIEF